MIKNFNPKREYWVVSPNYNQVSETFINKLIDAETDKVQWIKCIYSNIKIGIPIEDNRIFENREDADCYCRVYITAKMLASSSVYKYPKEEVQEAKEKFPHLFL